MSFHDRLKTLVRENKNAQYKIAEELGITPQSFSYFLQGREPSYDVLKKIAKYFNVSADYLLGIESETSIQTASLELKIKELNNKIGNLKTVLWGLINAKP